jgi:hypothetical protein
MGVERGRALGMPLAEFTEKAYAELAAGKEDIIIGNLHGASPEDTQDFVKKRQDLFNSISDSLAVHFKP